MTKQHLLAGLKAGAAPIVLGFALVSSPALAQSTDASQQQDQAPTSPATALPNAAPANGDTTTSDTQSGASGQDIVVTGSRIPQPNLTAISPVTVVNSQEFKLSGTTRTEDLLNTLPQVFADQGSGVSNAATGTATVNLRGLGADRTLVLIDGRRLVPGDPTDSAADINFIPAALIKRVDVLTGGASSTYGADAVGGVVNFIMDTDFTGFKLDSQYSLYQHSNHADFLYPALAAANFGAPHGDVADGGTIDTTAVVGASFDDDRGHVVAYVGYRKVNAVVEANRDYSACGIGGDVGSLSCGGSATANNIVAFTGGSPTDVDKNGNPKPYGNATSTYFVPSAGRTFQPGPSLFNFNPTNYFQRPDERYTMGFFAHYDVSDAFKPYLEGMFMDDRTVAQIAASGDFGNTFATNCDNPLLGAQQLAVICNQQNLVAPTVVKNVDAQGNVTYTTAAPSYSNTQPVATVAGNNKNFPGMVDANGIPVPGAAFAPFTFTNTLTGGTYNKGFAQPFRRDTEGGPRQDDLQHTSYRIVGGARGDINKAFSYDAYYQYGRTNFAETYLNEFSATRLGRALDVVTGPGGTPVCRSVLDGTDPNCVPYDIFSPGGVTPEQVNYLSVPGLQRGQVTEQVASASLTGQLGEYGIKSPWANDGVGINIGAEYRREKLNFVSDLEFQTGDLTGQGAPTLPVSGAFNVYEGFGELRVPIVQQGFFYDLSFDGGYRYSHYDVADRSFNTSTYKLGGDFAPVRSIRIRGAYNRAVRAPNIQDFFAPQRVALDGTTDPCSGFTITTADTGCIAQGLAPGAFVAPNPANQYNGLIGGNPDLTPEKADTYTLGAVLQPDFVPFLQGLAITVDYFNIKVKNVIQGIGADTIVSVCTADGSSPFCGLIHRDPSGSLWKTPQGYIVDTTQNLGSLKTSGIDVGASYAHALGGLGSLSLNFNGTYLKDLSTDNGVAVPYDCSGLYGNQCGTPNPKWRHKARITFTLPDGIGLSGQWRYFGSVKQDSTSSNPTLAGAFTQFDQKIGAQSFFDLAMTATVGEHYNFHLGVQNILDTDPPLVTAAACPAGPCNGNTYPVVYDALGRYIYAGVTLDF